MRLALAAACVSISMLAADSGSVDGRVINAKTGQPMQKVDVALQLFAPGAITPPKTLWAATNSEGKFHFEKLSEGRYGVDVTFPFPSRNTAVRVVELAAGEGVTGIELKLPPPAAISGAVTSSPDIWPELLRRRSEP